MLKFENDAVHVHIGFAVMEHRGRRNRIPNEHRERIVRTFEDPREKRRNVNTITARKCAEWFRFMQAYIPRCLSGELIEGLIVTLTVSLL